VQLQTVGKAFRGFVGLESWIFPRTAHSSSFTVHSSQFAVHSSPFAVKGAHGRHQTHAKLKSILTFAFSAPLW
jgi:hypothetical protein